MPAPFAADRETVMPMNTGNELLIREANASDVAELARLRWDSRADQHSVCSRDEFLRDCEAWLREKLTSSSWFMAVAEYGSGLSGCMFLQCIEEVPAPASKQRAWG